MNKALFYILFIIFSFSFNANITAQKTVKKDKSKITINNIPKEKITNYRNSNDFKYAKLDSGINLWDKIVYLFFKFIEKIFSNQGAAPYIRFTILALLIAFVIFKLLGYKFSSIFFKGQELKEKNGINFHEQDIDTIDFDKEIKTAVKNTDFRLAIRFHYLKLLKTLNNKKIIDWQLNKTNRQYLFEMKHNENYDNFKNLSNIYEYCWYGDFKINEERYLKMKSNFIAIFDRA